MNRISKNDYIDLMAACINLIKKNLDILNIEKNEIITTYKCNSEIVGNLNINIEDFSMVGSVYSIFIQFEHPERLLELVGENYYKANIFHTNSMNILGFAEQKEFVYNRFYDIIDAIIGDDNEVIE